jgi:hypothetical protein
MDLFYRNYDPALGRMNQVDPMASRYASHTPYNYSLNDPVYYNDPLGDESVTGGKAYCGWCYFKDRPIDSGNGGGGGGGSDGGSGYQGRGFVTNPGFSAAVWSILGGIVNSLWERTDPYNGKTDWNAAELQGYYAPIYRAEVVYNNAALTWTRTGNVIMTGYRYVSTLGNYIGGLAPGFPSNPKSDEPKQKNDPFGIEAMVFNTDNPYLYKPAAYVGYNFRTGQLDIETKSFSRFNIKSFATNKGFTQLPRKFAKSSVFDSMGDYAQDFWRMMERGNGYFMTDNPLSAVMDYLRGSPFGDITFRFRMDVVFDNHNYNVVINVTYKSPK